MIAMPDLLVPAVGTVDVIRGMGAAFMLRRAPVRIRSSHIQCVIVNMIAMDMVQVPVMKIIGVPVVPDRGVPAIGTMDVGMLFPFHTSRGHDCSFAICRHHGAATEYASIGNREGTGTTPLDYPQILWRWRQDPAARICNNDSILDADAADVLEINAGLDCNHHPRAQT